MEGGFRVVGTEGIVGLICGVLVIWLTAGAITVLLVSDGVDKAMVG